jgi:hypothetical protein
MKMKRRTFSLLTGTSMMALVGPRLRAFAQPANSDFASLSKTTLTPMGSERAGNAAGTIPAWTGGMTSIPEGINWDPETELAPDFWADEAPLYVVDSSNMAQYASVLTEGVQTLIQKKGFSLKVYPTHRTAAAPQWIYDNIVQNSTRAQLNPAGGRLGFTGGYGGIPFPIPDVSNPLDAGAQIMWNHSTRWDGSEWTATFHGWNGVGGRVEQAFHSQVWHYSWYDQENGSLDSYKGYSYAEHISLLSPATIAGTQLISKYATNPLENPDIAWELLLGQGRVRKAPEIAYDTPSSFVEGLANYDEYFGFEGALDRYDWRFVEKKEMLIPYNNNKMLVSPSETTYIPNFVNPDVLRWELHRVWVVEATLHPGERNVLARRMLYVDEDTWTVGVVDSWDGNENIYKLGMNANCVYPNLPGTILFMPLVYDLQKGDYTATGGPGGEGGVWSFKPSPMSLFEPEAMAAAASY